VWATPILVTHPLHTNNHHQNESFKGNDSWFAEKGRGVLEHINCSIHWHAMHGSSTIHGKKMDKFNTIFEHGSWVLSSPLLCIKKKLWLRDKREWIFPWIFETPFGGVKCKDFFFLFFSGEKKKEKGNKRRHLTRSTLATLRHFCEFIYLFILNYLFFKIEYSLKIQNILS